MMAVKSIIYDRHLTLIGPYTSLQGIFQGPLWYYLLSITTFLFGGDPRGNVILMLVISMTVIVATFLVMRRLFGNACGLISAFLVATAPEAIAAATYSWNPHPMWLLLTIFFFILYQVCQSRKKYHLFLWPVIALMFHFEIALAVFILAGTLIYFLIWNRKLFINRYFLIGMLLSGMLFLPLLVFDVRHNFLMTKSFSQLFQNKDQGLFTKGEYLPYLNQMDAHLNSLYINYRYVFQANDLISGFSIIAAAGFLVSLFIKGGKFYTKKERGFLLLFVKFFFIFLALTFLYPFPLRYWFLTGFQMIYILPFSLFFRKLLTTRIGVIFVVAFVGITLIVVAPKLYKLYRYPDYGGVAKIRGKTDAINFIYQDAKGKPFGLFVFNPPVYTDSYDYLTYFLSQRTYHYLPHKEKKGTFYLLIEPDYDKPWSYKGWTETVIKTGSVLKTWELPSGLIVQKRQSF